MFCPSPLEAIVWFKKISIPLAQGWSLKFQRGAGGSKAQEFSEWGGGGGSFQTGSIITIIMFKFNLFFFSFLSQGHKTNSRIKIIYQNLQIEDKCSLLGNQA